VRLCESRQSEIFARRGIAVVPIPLSYPEKKDRSLLRQERERDVVDAGFKELDQSGVTRA